MKRLRFENGDVDAVDVRLLGLLAANARTSTAELARAVGMSSPSVAERLRRLEEAGVIAGYGLILNPAALGLPVAVWLRIRPVPGQLATVAAILAGRPEITECDRITGEDCFLARAQLPSLAALEELINAIIPYAMTNTAIVQSRTVPPRLPVLPAGGQSGR